MHVQQADPETAREYLESARNLAREIGFRALEPHAVQSLAEIDEADGRPADALPRLEQAVALARELGMRDFLAVALVSLGEFLARERGPEEARPHLEKARDVASETGRPGPAVSAACHLALLPGGDSAAALATFDENEARLGVGERMNARFLLWKSTHDAAHLTEAKRLLDEIIAHSPEDRREPMLTNIRLNREVTEAWKEHGG